MTKWLIVVTGLLTLAACNSASSDHVSLVALIANPDRYDGKAVSVVGYATFEFEHEALYFSQTDADLGITSNALWLDVTRAKDKEVGDKQWVLVVGTFERDERGHMGRFAGGLTSVRRFETWHISDPKTAAGK